jgi:nitrogen fixation protein NifU and related proteins
MYSDKVLDHFRNPRNMGEMKRADVEAQEGNPVCGDVMKIYLKVKKGKSRGENVISDIKFQTLGCVAAVATTSMVTEMVKGKKFLEAEEVSEKAVAEALDGLPGVKMHCSSLATIVLKKAMRGYK